MGGGITERRHIVEAARAGGEDIGGAEEVQICGRLVVAGRDVRIPSRYIACGAVLEGIGTERGLAVAVGALGGVGEEVQRGSGRTLDQRGQLFQAIGGKNRETIERDGNGLERARKIGHRDHRGIRGQGAGVGSALNLDRPRIAIRPGIAAHTGGRGRSVDALMQHGGEALIVRRGSAVIRGDWVVALGQRTGGEGRHGAAVQSHHVVAAHGAGRSHAVVLEGHRSAEDDGTAATGHGCGEGDGLPGGRGIAAGSHRGGSRHTGIQRQGDAPAAVQGRGARAYGVQRPFAIRRGAIEGFCEGQYVRMGVIHCIGAVGRREIEGAGNLGDA